jgi:hypothetical protein
VRVILRWRRVGYLPFFLAIGARSLPVLVSRRGLGPGELRMMVHLTAIPAALPLVAAGCAMVMLDQGPLFMLARLTAIADERHDRRIARWVEERTAEWAARIALVVRVDARDSVLLSRIKARSKWHCLKEAGPAESSVFLAGWRSRFDQVIERMSARQRITMLAVDTEREPVGDIVERIRAECRRAARAPCPSGPR